MEEIKIKKKILLSKVDQEKADAQDAEKTYIEAVANEVIKIKNDEMVVRNFEVEFADEEEIRYAGGIKGIKALRMQRELIHETHDQTQQVE